jgi:hypothetical protein
MLVFKQLFTFLKVRCSIVVLHLWLIRAVYIDTKIDLRSS